MSEKLIECVPNFSEGRSQEVLDAITSALRSTEGVSVIGVDPGKSTNRTVFTFVGNPEAVVNGAFNAAKVAVGLIDMRLHSGEHPRLGAMDVCPFVPVRNATMEDCADCANKLGRRLGEELGIPVYLYGAAALDDYRRTVPQIRQGEYEGLAEKLKDLEKWKPNYGPSTFLPNWGASMVGARNFLLAYNINMLSTKEQAHRIALNLREAGRGTGKPGKFKAVQGIGWWLDEQNLAQISLNLTDQDKTSLFDVYEEAVKDARELNLSVVGSELVGLVPLSALLTTADLYIKKENLFILEEEQKVRLAIERLGLNSLYPFDPKERVIEWRVRQTDPPRPLLDTTVNKFVDNVRSRSPAPGGGSVAALVGALGASLGSMVGLLTYGKLQWAHLDEQMRRLIKPLYEAAEEILPMVEADTTAFDKYIAAIRKTKSGSSPEAQTALLEAINVPLGLAKKLDTLWPTIEELFPIGNPNCLSDIQVGIKCIETGIWGARCNVLINCESLEDKAKKSEIIQEVEKIWECARKKTAEILKFDNITYY